MPDDVVKAHEAALEKLEALKAKCGPECVDEAVHAPHRASMEAAYAELFDVSRERAEAGV